MNRIQAVLAIITEVCGYFVERNCTFRDCHNFDTIITVLINDLNVHILNTDSR